jgi:CRP-like cAMP-binding protein
MQRRSRIKQTRSFVERLIEHAESVRAKAASLSMGAERDAILEKLEQTERAVEISRWLSSAELQPPRRGS